MKNARQVCSCRDVGELSLLEWNPLAQLLLVSSNLIILFGHTVFTEAS